MNAQPIVQYWHAKTPPAQVQSIFASYERHNPGMPHLVFNEGTSEEFIAEDFATREVAAFRACAVPAMQADYFRYCAIHALGGVYADARFFCKSPMQTLVGNGEGQIFRHPLDMVMNGFFVFPAPGSSFLRLVLDVVTANIESRKITSIPGATGPTALTRLSLLYRLGSIDTFLHVSKQGAEEWDPRPMVEAVGSYERVTEAFKRVKTYPVSRLASYIEPREVARRHWSRWGADIYR